METKELNDELFQEKVSLLSMNNLSFELGSALSVCASRNKYVQFSQPSTLNNVSASSQALIIFNQGSAFINGFKSLLNFSVKVNAGTAADFNYWSFGKKATRNSGGSCQNLISQVILQSRGGEVLFQNIYHNVYAATTTPWKHNKEGYKVMTMLGGADENGNFPLYPVGKTIQFGIPLYMLSDLFSIASLLPPQALAGAKLLISYSNLADAIMGWTDANTQIKYSEVAKGSYTVDNINLSVDMSELYDSANQLIQASANNLSSSGLQTSFKTYYAALFSPNAGTVSLDLNISAAKISNLFVRFIQKPPDDLTTWENVPMAGASIAELTGVPVDDFNTLNKATWQTRLGSQQIPLFAVNTATETYKQIIDGMCSWKNAGIRDVDALSTLNRPDAVPITYYDFYGNSDVFAPDGSGTGCFGICVDYEKSNAVGIAGVSSNNSKLITLQLNGWKNLANYNVLIFVELMSVINSTSQNNVVDR